MTRREFVAKARGRGRIELMRLRKWRLIRKVKAKKRARALIPQVYTETPGMSLVIQSFNHRANIEAIVAGVRRTDAEELIVCEDGSVDGSDAAWRRQMDRPNDFLIQTNDLHEIRTYNRAASLARGEVVALMQDDDIPPDDGRWVADAMRLFRAHPDLGVLGCWNGCALDFTDFNRSIGAPVGPGDASDQSADDIPTCDPVTGIPFMFLDAVGIGPIFIRRDAFMELGGFDLRLSGPGEPGIWLDYDLCLRMWLSGRRVGLFATEPFRRNVGGQGTMMFTGGKRSENYKRNQAHVERTFAGHIDAVHETIRGLNAGLLTRMDAAVTR